MNSDAIKKKCAKEALKFITNNTTIGLGGGSTISYLIDYIKKEDLQVRIVTPSFKTRMLCLQNGLTVLHTSAVDHISVAFDGCDEVDKNLHALKSGGGIHTKEKIIASMADDYILLVDNTKVVNTLTFKHPVVLEILEDSLHYVEKKVVKMGGKFGIRTCSSKDGVTISDNGNLLVDVYFQNVENHCTLEKNLKKICGVIDSSLFTNVVTKVVIASENDIKVLSK